MSQVKQKIRNVAIIAHVDHGKTTLVDELLKQSGTFRENQVMGVRIMDSNDLEKERGITILSKNTSVVYKDTKINIVDTPGHADFGGEVERVLKMVDGVILVVDAFEGPMPQTKFVLKNALELKLPVLICVNKVDRPEARPEEVVDEVLELFMELEATDEQLDSPCVFTSAKQGISFLQIGDEPSDMGPLFDSILKYVPEPKGDPNSPLQMLITTIDHNEYVGRIGIGKVENGTMRVNDDLVMVNIHEPGKVRKVKINKLYEYDGLNRVEVKEASSGSIIAVAGIEDIFIGDTLCAVQNPVALEFNKISEPTIAMTFLVNNSPFAGLEGKFVTSRHVRARLHKELNTDVSLRVEDTDSTEAYKVSGRGELHLSILIETMRREGYEFQVSKPEVLFRMEDGKKFEPQEKVTIDVPEEFCGTVIEKLGKRKGEMTYMAPSKGGYTRLIFEMPSRGLIGYRTDFMTDTKGNGILNTEFDKYIPFKGEIETRSQGSLVAYETGVAVAFGLYNAQERGELFITPGTKLYGGMVVGRNARLGDMEVNVCKKKQLTNVRASSSDDALKLTPITVMSLEKSLEFIGDDELVEITPLNLRIRKKILESNARNRANRK
jgi:GTP-binding protein